MIMSQSIKYCVLALLFISVLANAKRNKCSDKLACDCGSSTVDKYARIINGGEAVPCSWPMIVSLRYDFLSIGNSLMHACGGTIITDSYILTAASCLEAINNGITLANITIAAAIHNRSQPDQTIRKVDKVIIHQNWKGSLNGYQNDIALIHLSKPLDIHSVCIARTCVPPQLNITEQLVQYPSNDERLVVIGWGRAVLSEYESDVLRQALVVTYAYNNTKCANVVNDPKTQFCTGSSNHSTGDFGGPILNWIGDRWEQVGIISFAPHGCTENSLIVYTRLAFYRDWIEEHIKDNEEITEDSPTIITILPVNATDHPSITYQCDKYTVPCGCGWRSVQFPVLDTIVANVATPYSWSMIVSIRVNGITKHSCSGSILSEYFILTSASCIANVPIFGISIAAGVHNHSEIYATIRKVDQIFLHSDYKGESNNYANDIAILHISLPLDFDNDRFVSRTCLSEKLGFNLPFSAYPEPRKQLALIGWGVMDCRNKTDQDLFQQVQIYSIDQTTKSCFVLDEYRNIQFCAGADESRTIPCVGDPGSPIFEWLDDRWQQVGIASHRVDYAPFKNSGIYTRIIEYNNWIQSIISNCSVSSPAQTTTTTGIMMNSTIPMNTTNLNIFLCNKTLACGCGTNPVIITSSRIVGGENAVENSWPMVVSLRRIFASSHDCGGTILSNFYILTAAHCIPKHLLDLPVGMTIGTGMINISDSNQIRRTVDRVYVHPNYNGIDNDYRHDIAVLHLNESLAIEKNEVLIKTCIHSVESPILDQQYIKNGKLLTVIGWGFTEENTFIMPKILQQVKVYAIDNNDPICQGSINDTKLQFCAGLAEGGKDSFQGDSGGPIFKWTGQYWEQVGLVSYGHGCARSGEPGIYTRLSYYYDWINSILKNDSEHLEPGSPLYTTTTARTDITTIRTNGMTRSINMTTIRTIAKSGSFNHTKSALICATVIVFLTFML